MKRTLLSAGLSVMVVSILISGAATAGRNANGAMVVHVLDQLDYCTHDFCVEYPLPTTCEAFDTQVDRDPSLDSVIWLVAAFPSNSSPGVNAFQLGLAGDVTIGYVDASAVCGPGALEIPDTNWPGAGAGDAVAYMSTVYSSLFKMYWLFCGAPGVGSTLSTTNYYQGDHRAEWADDSNPPVVDYCDRFGTAAWGVPGHNDCPPGNPPTGACCFPGCYCQVLTQQDCATAGGTYYGDGTTCTPDPCDCPPGACCFPDGSCIVTTQFQCESQGGAFQGMGTVCSPNPCQPPGACCYADCTCRVMTAEECQSSGGVWYGAGTNCDPNPCSCPPMGACCLPDGSCQTTLPTTCEAIGGIYQGDGTTCSPNPCQPTPTRPTTWGRIKAGYR